MRSWSCLSNWRFWFFNWTWLCNRSFCLLFWFWWSLYWLWWSLNGLWSFFRFCYCRSFWILRWFFFIFINWSLWVFFLFNFSFIKLLSSLLIIFSFFLQRLKLSLCLFLLFKTFLNIFFNLIFLWLILFLSLLECFSSSSLLGTSLVHCFVSLLKCLSSLFDGFTCFTARLVLYSVLNVILFKVKRLVENWMFSDFLLSIFESDELLFFL